MYSYVSILFSLIKIYILYLIVHSLGTDIVHNPVCHGAFSGVAPDISHTFITNQVQIFHLPRSSRTMVHTVSLLIPNSSTINHRVSRRSRASICRTRLSIMSGVLLVHSRPERGSSAAVSFPSQKRKNTFSAHAFHPAHLPPTFHPSPFSPIFSRTCSLTLPVTPTTFHCLQQVYPDGHEYSTLGGASRLVSG